MPWEWKEEPQTVPAQTPADQKQYASVKDLAVLTWCAIIFSIIATIAFALLVGFSRDSVSTNDNDQFGYAYTTSYSGGYTAGIVLIVIAALSSFVLGFVMLARSWSPVLARERVLIIAMGVITLFCGLVFITIVMGVIVLIAIAPYRRATLETSPSFAPTPPPIV